MDVKESIINSVKAAEKRESELNEEKVSYYWGIDLDDLELLPGIKKGVRPIISYSGIQSPLYATPQEAKASLEKFLKFVSKVARIEKY